MTDAASSPVWNGIESQWPARLESGIVPFPLLRENMQDFLVSAGVRIRAFSHYGLVVSHMASALSCLSTLSNGQFLPSHTDWVPSFSVHVARGPLYGVEIEFIQPDGKSFFEVALRKAGEGLHHMSFEVEDIEDACERLSLLTSVRVEGGVRRGSHGKVLFIAPQTFQPLYIEMCQPIQEESVDG